MNLFEDLKEKCSCNFISDMAVGGTHNTTAKAFIPCVQLKNYELWELTDMYKYLTGEKKLFENMNVAIASLRDL